MLTTLRFFACLFLLMFGFASTIALNAQTNVSVATAKVIDSFPHTETNVNTTGGGTASGMIGSCHSLPCCSVLVYKVILPLDGSLRIENDNFVNYSGSIIAYSATKANPTDWSDLVYTSSYGNFCGFRDTLQLGYGYQWPQYDPAAPNVGDYYDVSKAAPAGEYYILIFNQNQQANIGSNPSSNITFEYAPACPIRNSVVNATVCSGESITVNGTVYDTTITGAVEVIDDNGPFDCDSTVTINLTVLPEISSDFNATICTGDSLNINGTIYKNSVSGAREVFVGAGVQGCDSIVLINLNVLTAHASTLRTTICAGEQLEINGSIYTETTMGAKEVFTNVGSTGCDSIVTIELTVLPAKENHLEATICDGESITINGTIYDADLRGEREVISNIGPYGCDSTVIIDLTVLPAKTGSLTQTLCAGEGIMINNTFYDFDVSGAVEVFSGVGPYGCDSSLTINLSIADELNTQITQQGTTLSADIEDASYQWLDCFSGFLAIPDAINQTFSPAEIGDYAVAIMQNGCIDTSACFSVLSVGLENPISQRFDLQIYPNPSTGAIEIQFDGSIDPKGLIQIYSIDQKLLEEFDFTRPSRTLDLSQFAAGIYLVRYGDYVKKLVLRP
ncbi:MAG: T9SS type A sorting domain-containing protein [Bacteroidia bacterium]